MDPRKPRKRRAYGHCTHPEFYKFARADFNLLERFPKFQKVVLSGCARSDAEDFRPGRIRSGGFTNPLGRILRLFCFSLFCCSGLDSGLGFSPFVILKCKFSSGGTP